MPPRHHQKLHFGPARSELHVGVDIDRMRRERADRMRALMRAKGVPTLLLAGADNVRYLTGFHWGEFQLQTGYALFFAEGDPVVFSPAGSLQQMPDQTPWVSEWRPAISWLGGVAPASAITELSAAFAAQIRDELAERSLTGEQLAVSEIDEAGMRALHAAGIDTVPGLPLLLECGTVKTADEIACISMAASLATAGYETVRANLRPGVRQAQLATAARRAIEDAGAEAGAARLLSGPLSFPRGISGGDRIVEYGDLAYLLTCGTSYMGYTACLYRQFIVGRAPTAMESSSYTKLTDRLDHAISLMRPGASTADVAAVLAPAEELGFGSETECFSLELGHGVGLVNAGSRAIHYNPPVITREWSFDHPEEIKEGMVIAIEGIEGQHRVGGVRLENLVVITANGAELLDHYQRDEMIQTAA
ncbi:MULTISPECIES: Xaa-Pro peptidase family protein [unclassified Streptomyces]|uniref:M24 family metallopeptidase n=1 Tax=unclassified Streptomyces TaxID=2593676 RepID=UPI00225155C8|nr:M24 family metallopeptidase [Streptomyces sp. NBC_01446]MCX4641756.1 M24 family metallopeptidase [Streptomyces sp. NBC_01446]